MGSGVVANEKCSAGYADGKWFGGCVKWTTTGNETLNYFSQITGEDVEGIAKRNGIDATDPNRKLTPHLEVELLDPQQVCDFWRTVVNTCEFCVGSWSSTAARWCDTAKDFHAIRAEQK